MHDVLRYVEKHVLKRVARVLEQKIIFVLSLDRVATLDDDTLY